MPSYHCKLCDYTTSKMSHYKKHISSRKHIDAEAVDKVINQKPNHESQSGPISSSDKLCSLKATKNEQRANVCDLCGEVFAHSSSLYRHKRKFCKESVKAANNKCNRKDMKIHELKNQLMDNSNKVYSNDDIVNIVKLYADRGDDMDSLLLDLQQNKLQIVNNNTNSGNNNTNNSHNNNNNNYNNCNNNNNVNNIGNINNNLVVNAYGQENTAYISDHEMIKYCKTPRNMIPEYFKKVHFDKNHPENHNIRIPNRKEKNIEVMKEDGTWKTDKQSKVLPDMVDNSYNAVVDFFEHKETHDPIFIRDNMLKDEINTFKKYVDTIEEERNANNVNKPHMQPYYNDAVYDCRCVVLDANHMFKELEREKKMLEQQVKESKRKNRKLARA